MIYDSIHNKYFACVNIRRARNMIHDNIHNKYFAQLAPTAGAHQHAIASKEAADEEATLQV
jgi:hypothetical protein